MISITYATSGLLLAATGCLFAQDAVRVRADRGRSVIFFFASAAASAAYLTVSETFPLEIRALAIALFYAVRHRCGWRDRSLADGHADRDRLAGQRVRRLRAGRRPDDCRGRHRRGFWSVAAERKPLEAVARPLALED